IQRPVVRNFHKARQARHPFEHAWIATQPALKPHPDIPHPFEKLRKAWPNRGGNSTQHIPNLLRPLVKSIAPKELVAPVASKAHRDISARQFAEQERRNV